jgi:HSP20 family protein
MPPKSSSCASEPVVIELHTDLQPERRKAMRDVKIANETTHEPVLFSSLSDLDIPLFPEFVTGAYPFSFFKRLADELDRSFGRTTATFGPSTFPALWRPAIEVKKENDKFFVHAELPGLKKENVKITITEGVLVIEGERKGERNEKHEGYFRSERNYGKFYRAVPLPKGVKAEAATANFASGVLEIIIPAAEIKKVTREIPVAEGKAEAALTH